MGVLHETGRALYEAKNLPRHGRIGRSARARGMAV
jgi:Zn-dependent M32 family carboxypeptidase